jgi:hypothetical protein
MISLPVRWRKPAACNTPAWICNELACGSTIWLDWKSARSARESDILLSYSGVGIRTTARFNGTRTLRIVEVERFEAFPFDLYGI